MLSWLYSTLLYSLERAAGLEGNTKPTMTTLNRDELSLDERVFPLFSRLWNAYLKLISYLLSNPALTGEAPATSKQTAGRILLRRLVTFLGTQKL